MTSDNNDATVRLLKKLKILVSPDMVGLLTKFIDTKRFIQSEEFSLLASHAIKHAQRHHDTNQLLNLLRLLETSQHYQPVLLWICASTGYRYKVVDGIVKIRPQTKEPPLDNCKLEPYLITHKGTFAQVVREYKQSHPAPSRKSAKDTPPYLDALDSPARLPGCYGMGKRR